MKKKIKKSSIDGMPMPARNMNELAMELCAYEGLKSQINIADMKEVLKQLSISMALNSQYAAMLINNGLRIINKDKK